MVAARNHGGELDRMLAGNAGERERDARAEFDRMAGSRANRIVLHGAGGLGRRALAGLRAAGVEPLAFCDNGGALQGATVDGLRVFSPAEAAELFGSDAVFVVTIWGANSTHRYEHSRAQLQGLGCDIVLPFPILFWKYPNGTLPHYLQDSPHKVIEASDDVRQALDLWHDDASRAEYVSQVGFRLNADFVGLSHPVEHAQYFATDLFAWRDDEQFVDGGAYDGDTVRSIVSMHGCSFARVLAFEPDPANFARLEELVGGLEEACRDKIICSRKALAARRGTLFLDTLGNASSTTSETASAGLMAVEALSLDEILADAAPTMIKLDIEGAEPEALHGARRIIERDAPILAICVYHQQDHLWSIPSMIKMWRPDYRMFLRPHNEEGWDLICYAIPPWRLRASASG